jgi:hypothetical protein
MGGILFSITPKTNDYMNPAKPSLETFVDQLVVEKGLTNLDPEILAEAKRDLVNRAENRLNAAILEHIPPEKISEFETLLDGDDSNAVQSFVKASIPNLEQLVAETLMRFRQIYIQG